MGAYFYVAARKNLFFVWGVYNGIIPEFVGPSSNLHMLSFITREGIFRFNLVFDWEEMECDDGMVDFDNHNNAVGWCWFYWMVIW